MSRETIRILLVDDETDALNLMEELLTSINAVKVVGKANDKISAVTSILEDQPDVIFQDIQMQGENGLALADEYRKYHYNGKIVFVTAYAQYAIDAIRKNAYDYLLKPVDLDDLHNLVIRLRSDIKLKKQRSDQNAGKLKIPTRSGYIIIPQEEIIYCEADGNYTTIFKNSKEPVTTSIHLGKIEEDLNTEFFFRVSRSAIINIDYLASVNRGRQECVLQNLGQEYVLHISGNRLTALEDKI